MREVFEWHEAKPSASLASRALSQLSKCIHNLPIDAQLLKSWTISFRTLPLPLHSVFITNNTRQLIKYKILPNHSEQVLYWLNVSELLMHGRASIDSLAPYKKRARYCQLYSNLK